MGCLRFSKAKSKSRKDQEKSSTETLSVSTATTSSSNYDTSRSHDSAGISSASASSQRSISAMFDEKAGALRIFQLAELRTATNGFNRTLKIGEGGFGSVYKGFISPLDDKGGMITVAVKTLSQKSMQGHKQWLAEVQFLGVLEHPNLVKLIGYCSEDGERGIQRLLVYEYMPNKSLEYHLFNKSFAPLSWNVRLQIALGAAEGLAYLHEGIELQVIYRDFKASNVLLDSEFKPKLSDFGLAREGPTGDRTHVSTAVVGTFGYAAPEYIETGHLTARSDVYSFGIVLFELITGRRSLDRNRPKNEQKLMDWVKQFPTDSNAFETIIDPRLSLSESLLQSARDVAKLASSCLLKQARDRPRMSHVTQSLKSALQITSCLA